MLCILRNINRMYTHGLSTRLQPTPLNDVETIIPVSYMSDALTIGLVIGIGPIITFLESIGIGKFYRKLGR